MQRLSLFSYVKYSLLCYKHRISCWRDSYYLKSKSSSKVRYHDIVALYQRNTFQCVCKISLIDRRNSFQWSYYYLLCGNCLNLTHRNCITYCNTSVISYKSIHSDNSFSFVGRIEWQTLCNSSSFTFNFYNISCGSTERIHGVIINTCYPSPDIACICLKYLKGERILAHSLNTLKLIFIPLLSFI